MALQHRHDSGAATAFRSEPAGRFGAWVRRWQGLLRLVVGAAALLLGFWGWILKEPLSGWESLFNTFFRTLQMLTLQFPREITGGVPWQLNVARFLLPVVALFETYRLLAGSVRRPIRLALVGLWRDHVVVTVGRSVAGMHVLRRVRRHRAHVVAIAIGLAEDETALLEDKGIAVIAGDPRTEEAWHGACADRAAAVIVAHGDDVENLNAAVTMAAATRSSRARRARRDRAMPTMIVLIEDDALAEQVDIALDGASRDSGLRYRRLSSTDEAARALFLDPPLAARKEDRAQPSHLLVLGLGPGGAEVLRAALSLAQDAPGGPPCITVLAEAKEIAAEPLLAEGAIPEFVARPLAVACSWQAGLPAGDALAQALAGRPAVTLACVCRDDEAAVLTGLALARTAEAAGWPALEVCVHQREEDRFLARLTASDVPFANRARLRPFGGLLPEGAIARILDGQEETLPRAVHAHYLALLERQGPDAAGTRQDWDALAENLRHANRAAAEHVAVKLAAIGCALAPGPGASEKLTDAEIDLLAEIEHRRWSAERVLRGWRYGTPRDDRARLHPDLVPYAALGEADKEKDRDAVRAIPDIVRLAGMRIVREPLGAGSAGSRP